MKLPKLDRSLARRPLPTALAALFSAALLAAQANIGYAIEVGAPLQPTSTPVTTCNDDLSAGSLREVLLHATSGETVDMTSLQCSSISLGYGALFVTVDDLTIAGNGQTISGSINQNVLDHIGHGLLSVSAINLTYGRYDGVGGCLYSAGSVEFQQGSVSNCSASDKGGGIYVKGDLTLVDSVITGNGVGNHTTNYAMGGGAFASGNMSVKGCEISNSTATSTSGAKYESAGGGLYASGSFDIEQTTLSGNTAYVGGALFGSGISHILADSTISGNSGTNASAAFLTGAVTMESDTIAFNTNTCSTACRYAASLLVTASSGGAALSIKNTIASNNEGGDDIYITYPQVQGSHNLIITANASPPDTLHSDPRLAPLAINGSLLLVQPRTHALGAGSPAIDAGGATIITADERGLPRLSGAATDIGAYELQSNPDDTIFANGFD